LAKTSSYDYEIEQNYKIVFNKFKVLGSNPSEDFLADRHQFSFLFYFLGNFQKIYQFQEKSYLKIKIKSQMGKDLSRIIANFVNEKPFLIDEF
jgi:hypothetical protein